MKFLAIILLLLTTATFAGAQEADPALMAEIRKIRAIDNHSHPPRVTGAGEHDDEFDALPCDPLEPTEPNTMTRPENPQYLAAWKALWGYSHDDRSDPHVAELLATKKRIREEQGDHYAAWVLDKLGIETELANRVAMGRGLDAPRFRWVPFDDALLFPLDNAALAGETPDRKFFFGRENMLLARYRKELGVAALPSTLAEYITRVVTPELARQKQTGAVAIKFEAAYLRSLDFEPAAEQDAAAVYSKYVRGGAPAKSRLHAPARLPVPRDCDGSRAPGIACAHSYGYRMRRLFLFERIEPVTARIGIERRAAAKDNVRVAPWRLGTLSAEYRSSADETERVRRSLRTNLDGFAASPGRSPARLDRVVSRKNIIRYRPISR